MNTLHPRPEHKFAFGLWTIGHPGRDQFGEAVRPPIEPWEFVHRLGDLGGWGQLPRRRSRAARIDDRRARRDHRPLPQGLDHTGLVVSMATTNLFGNIRCSRTERSRPAIGTCGATPSRRRCGRSISAPSWVP